MTQARRPKDLFTHCPACGAGGLGCTGEKRFACEVCGQVFYFNTATGVAAIIEDDRGHLLAIERGKDPCRGMLDLPGGFVDGGESGEEALVREVREELGLAARELRFVCTHPNVYDYRGVRYDVLDLVFTARVDSFDGIAAADDAAGFRFIPREEVVVEDFAFASIRAGLRAWLDG